MTYALQFDPGDTLCAQEGIVHFVRTAIRWPPDFFQFLFVDLPEKYKYKLLGQVFCRPMPGYKLPRIPTVANVDNTKVIPQWPTIATHDKSSSGIITRGMSYDNVIDQWKKFAKLIVGISKISSDDDAGEAIDDLVDAIFSDSDFSDNGLAGGLRFKMVKNTWPNDKWFQDKDYKLVDTLGKITKDIVQAAKVILKNKYNFDSKSESLGCSSKHGMLRSLTTMYRKSTTKCYNFSGSLYKLGRELK